MRKQAQEAAWGELHTLDGPSIKRAIEAASDVWEQEMREIREVLLDDTTAPLKRIRTAEVYLKEALGD